MALRLAIIEDNADLLDELLAWLGYRGFEVWGTRSAEAFWRQLHSHPVDIVLVDIGLPGEDGFSVLNYLHELGHYGLVVVSARGQQQDKLQALSLGADAYLIKPVNFAHLAETLTALGARLRQDRPTKCAANWISMPACFPMKASLTCTGSTWWLAACVTRHASRGSTCPFAQSLVRDWPLFPERRGASAAARNIKNS